MNKKILLCYTDIGGDEINSVVDVLKSRHLERGIVTERVENLIKKKFGVANAILTSNGTGALIAGLKACSVGMNDEVITTPFTFAATVNSIHLVGAKPVYADIDELTYNIDPNKIEKKITKNTKAILTVDLYGQPCNYEAISKIAEKYNLTVIADSCQSLGARYDHKFLYKGVSLQVFSFFGNKIITSGEGGLVITDNKNIANKFHHYINHGKDRGYGFKYKDFGWNFRPTDIESALLKYQLLKLNKIVKIRQENAKYLTSKLKNVDGVETPEVAKKAEHSYFRYTIRVNGKFPIKRDDLVLYLNKHNIECEVAYPKPLHYYKHLSFRNKKGDFPNAELAAKEVLTLPVNHSLTKRDMDYIYKVIKSIS
jgi:dTDP-4-amino-4,6-dideoxygalactose transaminase